MDIKRDRYLNQLISYMWDGQVKVITGIRRCGKSYLLRVLFRKYLLEQGVEEGQILSYELALARDIQFRNPLLLSEAVRSVVEGSGERFYLFIDEIQMSDEVATPYNPEGEKDHLLRCLKRSPFSFQFGYLHHRQQFPNTVFRYPHRVPRPQ